MDLQLSMSTYKWESPSHEQEYIEVLTKHGVPAAHVSAGLLSCPRNYSAGCSEYRSRSNQGDWTQSRLRSALSYLRSTNVSEVAVWPAASFLDVAPWYFDELGRFLHADDAKHSSVPTARQAVGSTETMTVCRDCSSTTGCSQDSERVSYHPPVGQCFSPSARYPGDTTWGEYDILDTCSESSLTRRFFNTKRLSCCGGPQGIQKHRSAPPGDHFRFCIDGSTPFSSDCVRKPGRPCLSRPSPTTKLLRLKRG